MTSSILLALTDACGYPRIISVIMTKALRTWMAYDENTIMFANSIICSSSLPEAMISPAPIQ